MGEAVIGVDPGSRDGAIVALRDGEVVDWVGYWTRTTGMVAVMARTGTPHPVDGVKAAAQQLTCRGRVVIEQIQYYPGSRTSGHSVIPLAESAGVLEGVLQSTGPVLRVSASEWRSVVLGISARTKANMAERYAIAAVMGMLRIGPPEWARLPKVVRGALCEATCIALWGQRVGLRHARRTA